MYAYQQRIYFQNDQLNSDSNNTNVKRQTNVDDFCEPRFIATAIASTFQLIWACPNGTDPPSNPNVLNLICTSLIEANVLDSCTFPDGSTEVPPTPAPLQPIK